MPQTILRPNACILSAATVAGSKEHGGPLGACFDYWNDTDRFGGLFSLVGLRSGDGDIAVCGAAGDVSAAGGCQKLTVKPPHEAGDLFSFFFVHDFSCPVFFVQKNFLSLIYFKKKTLQINFIFYYGVVFFQKKHYLILLTC